VQRRRRSLILARRSSVQRRGQVVGGTRCERVLLRLADDRGARWVSLRLGTGHFLEFLFFLTRIVDGRNALTVIVQRLVISSRGVVDVR
jgi:hypothetical protein